MGDPSYKTEYDLRQLAAELGADSEHGRRVLAGAFLIRDLRKDLGQALEERRELHSVVRSFMTATARLLKYESETILRQEDAYRNLVG